MINMGVYIMSEEAEVTKTLDALTIKIDELSKALKENKELTEARIKENPLAYMAGAFAGGLMLGYLIARKS
jgi:ElaB/YqjD/DUF883 family membrane-anchored ribosome-binding protein